MRTKIEGGRGRDHAVSEFKNWWGDFEHGVEEVANSAGEKSENYSLEREVGGVVAIEDVVDCERDKLCHSLFCFCRFCSAKAGARQTFSR